MRYCEQGDLYQYIQRQGRRLIEEERVLSWTGYALLAIHYLHLKKIIHRDLKSQNFLLSKGRLFLADFGISKSLSKTTDLANTYVGTPYYMSPELFKYQPYSLKSDLWSLGCVIYELCSLKSAFSAQTINALAIKILKGEYQAVPAKYGKDLAWLIDSLLKVNPEERISIRQIV